MGQYYAADFAAAAGEDGDGVAAFFVLCVERGRPRHSPLGLATVAEGRGYTIRVPG